MTAILWYPGLFWVYGNIFLDAFFNIYNKEATLIYLSMLAMQEFDEEDEITVWNKRAFWVAEKAIQDRIYSLQAISKNATTIRSLLIILQSKLSTRKWRQKINKNTDHSTIQQSKKHNSTMYKWLWGSFENSSQRQQNIQVFFVEGHYQTDLIKPITLISIASKKEDLSLVFLHHSWCCSNHVCKCASCQG